MNEHAEDTRFFDTQGAGEQEIEVRHLLFSVLYRWRFVLILAVVFAVLLGSVKLCTSLRDLAKDSEAQETYEKEMDTYLEKQSKLEDEISDLERDILSHEEYLENSYLMAVDPFGEYVEMIVYYISTDYQIQPAMDYQDTDKTPALIAAYTAIIKSQDYSDAFPEIEGGKVRQKYVMELLKLSSSDQAGTITVTVTGSSSDQAENLIDFVDDTVSGAYDQLSETIGEHEVSAVVKSSYMTADADLYETQNKRKQELEDLRESLEKKNTSLEELEEPEPVVSSHKGALKSAVKYFIIGGVLGVFFAGFIICIVYLLSGRLYNEKDLETVYSLKPLMVFSRGRKNRPFSGIDNLIAYLDRSGAPEMSEDQSFDLLAARLSPSLQGVRKLLIAGSAPEARLLRAAHGLSTRLEDIDVISGGDLSRDASAIREAEETDCLILVEERGKSRLTDIEKEISTASSLGTPIAGTIVF